MSSRPLIVEGYVRRPGLTPGSPDTDSILFDGVTSQRGWRLARILHEQRGWDRLEDALQRVESGEIDGLVVAQLRDLGPGLREAVAAIDRIRAADGTLLSVNDRIELGRSTGLPIWRLLLSLAEW